MQNTNTSLQQLNLPFEFQEVLLSPRERAKLQKGLSAAQLFGGDEASVFQEFRTRELSVRLRTINNACDTMFTLPDGTPVTEVSLYGGRERQYLAAPYKAVKRLMQGEVPAAAALNVLHEVYAHGREIEGTRTSLAKAMEDVSNNGGIARITLAQRQQQVQRSDTPVVEAFLERLAQLAIELDALQEQIQTSAWWWPLTDQLNLFKAQGTEIKGRYQELLKQFLTDLYPELKEA